MALEIIEDTELKPDQSNIVKSGPITDSEYASFQITADASSVEGFDVFDDYAETMEKNFIGTWYCPSWGMAFRIQEDGAYIYTLESENIGFCNQEPYVWELTDRSQQGLCPRLSFYYDDSKAGDMFTCYVAGCTDDYFWCNLQEMVWYMGNRCNFVDELRVKRRAAFPLPKCCPYILTMWIREKTEPTAGK